MIPFSIFFKKELALESRYPLPLVQNLIISPMVTALPLFFVYRSVFATTTRDVAGWNGENYLLQIGVGLICHFCLNSGSYVLFNRLLAEWHSHTFVLLWFSPFPRVMNFLALSLSDILRALLFAVTITTFLFWKQIALIYFFAALALFAAFFLFGAAVGILRFFQQLLAPAWLDFVNFFTLGLLFTSGLYFPIGVLPGILHSVAKGNPFFNGKQLILSAVQGHFDLAAGALFFGPLFILWAVVFLSTVVFNGRITEACLKN